MKFWSLDIKMQQNQGDQSPKISEDQKNKFKEVELLMSVTAEHLGRYLKVCHPSLTNKPHLHNITSVFSGT